MEAERWIQKQVSAPLSGVTWVRNGARYCIWGTGVWDRALAGVSTIRDGTTVLVLLYSPSMWILLAIRQFQSQYSYTLHQGQESMGTYKSMAKLPTRK
jgi:hypothetical protein